MISNYIQPTKTQLIQNIQKLSNPKIDVLEVMDTKSKKEVIKKLDGMIKVGSYSIILIKN